MKTIQHILTIAAMVVFAAAYAQQGAPNQQSTNAGQQVNEPAQGTAASQQQVADTTGTANIAGAQANANDTIKAASNAASDPRASNTPAVQQTTSSQSGSPAVLSGEKGKHRDGTNNVQRAGMNMAGSPAGNLTLEDNRTVDPDEEMQDRQEYTQEKQVSAGNQGEGATPSRGDSEEINEKSRKENNKMSDQNLSSKEKKNQDSRKSNDKKDSEKPKKNKDRG